jgi:hypothetical protein
MAKEIKEPPMPKIVAMMSSPEMLALSRPKRLTTVPRTTRIARLVATKSKMRFMTRLRSLRHETSQEIGY